MDAAGRLGEQPYVAVRQGNDLVLLYADGTEVVLQDYFLGDTLFSMDGLGGVIELPADMAPIGTVDGKALYAFGGSPDAAGSILAKSSSFSPLEPLLADDTLGAALIGEGSVGLALAGLGAGGLGLAAMGGGGGAGAFFGSVSNALTIISGTFVAGPVIPGNGLVVDLYDNTGALLQAGIPLNEDGSFSVTLQGTFPNVIAIMRDLNENPDYRDEATGADTDLNATLMGLGAGDPQPNGTTNVALNINPVTTVAARLAGVSAEGEIPAEGVSPEKITESIQQVQETFGLSDINGVAPKDIFDEDFDDTDGDIDDGEQYGQVLAMLSGKDKLNQGDQGATIEEFVSAIEDAGDDTAAAQSAVRSELLAGAREFEFNNEDGTETEADLLRAPSLGVERTPEVGEDGQTTEPEFSALLEDSLKGTSTGSAPNANADTIEGFQTLVDTADAIQALAALDTGAEIPQHARDQLTEENLTAMGLTGLAAPSPYLGEFLEALRDAEAGGADTVAELQALLDDIIQDILSPSQNVTPNDDGTLSVSGTGEPGSTVTTVFPDGTSGTAVVADDGSYGPITSEGPQTTGEVSVTATDAAGNTSEPLTEAYSDTTAPLAPSQNVTPNDDGTLSVSGTGEPGSTVTTTFPDGTTGTAVVADDGTYGPITSEAPQTTGAVSTRQSDEAGNTSPLTTEAYTDTTAPTAPTIDTVTPNEDGTLSASGTGEPGSTATVRFPDGTIGAAVVGPDGTFGPITSSAPQTSGDVTATQTDGAGNVSPTATVPFSDEVGPQAPVLGAIEQTLDGTLSVSGTGEPGAIATVTFPDGSTGTTTVRPDGSFGPVTSDAPQTDGAVSAVQTDEAGNPSAADTAEFDDAQAPLAPSNLVATANEDGTIDVSGTGEPGSTATVTFPDGTTATALVGEDGTFGPVTSDAPQTSGTVSATQTDEAGNTSAPVATEAYFDETPPLPVNLIVTPNDDGTIDVSGTGEPGSTATVIFPDGTSATTTIGDDGTFGPVTSAAPQTTGPVSATQTDEANNVSEPSTEDYVDTNEPLNPTVGAVTPNDDGTLSISGTGEPGATMTVFFPDGTTATALVEADGTYGPVTSDAPQTSGDVIVNQVDEAGNQSDDVVSPYTDETAPLEPFLEPATQNEDGTLSVSGTGEPGSTVQVTFPDGTVGSALVDDSGNFGPVTSAAPQTSGEVSATQTDEAGNTSDPATEAYSDTTAPEAPSQVVTVNDDGTLSVSGTGEPGSTVTTEFPDGSTATALVAADGSYGPITSEAPQTTGDVSVTATDAAGNTSEPLTEAYSDTTAPLSPSQDVTTNDDGTLSVSGTGEPGSTVTTTFPDGTTGTALVAEDGSYGPVTSEGPQTTGTVSSSQTDEAGNTSDLQSETVTDETAPLAPEQTVTTNDDGTLSVSGTGEPGSTVTTVFPDGTSGTAVVNDDGSYGPITSEAPQTTGEVSSTQTDEAGNTSDPQSETVTDETAPLAPEQTVTPNDDGTLSVSGTGEPGSTVTTVFPDGTSGTAVVNDDGSYGPITSEGPQTTGEVSSTQTDEAGNTSDPQSETVTDETAPLAPEQTVTTNDDGTLSVSGTGEPGSTVTTTFPDGTTGTALVAEDGSYGPITSEAPQTTGDVSVTATDAAGNTSEPLTEAYSDTTAPLAPSQDVTPNEDGTLSVSGTGEPGSTVTTTFPDGTTGTAVVADDGTYGPITSEAPQTTGAVSTRQSDEAGNTSPLTTEAYTDTTAPTAPTIDTVTPNEDGTLSVSGTGEPGSTATVRFPDGTIGAAVVGPDGTFGPITSSSPQTSGDVTATQTDGAGNVSPTATVPFSDEVGPQASVLGAIEQTLDGTLSVSGTGEPGAIATVTFPDGSTGTTTVRPDGSFGPVTSDAPQTDGAVSAVQTDEAGNPSAADTAEFDDAQAPLAPSNLVATANEDGTIDVSGTGEPGSTATVTFPDGTTATVLVGEDGTFGPVTSAVPQTSGTVSATQTDEAGNTSAPAATEAYFDETPPLPVNLIVTPNDDGTIDVSGTGEPGSTATVIFPDGTSATTTIGDDGAFGPVTSAAPQTTGPVSATQTDEANNVSEPSTEDYVDTNEPLNPTVGAVTPNDDGTLSISGTGEPGATMTVFFPDGTTATALVEADGTYGPVTSDAPQTSGDVIVNQVDEAGNQSDDVVSPYTDETAPLEPVIEPATQNEDGTLSVSGTGEPGSTVQVTFPDGTVGSALVDDSGNFGPVTSAAPQTSGEVSATQTDEAGNTSDPATEAYSDTTAPEAPSQVVTPNTDGTLSVSGTGEPGSTVTTEFPDGSTATALVAADGSYGPITSEAPQTTGDVSVTATDAAGNTSVPLTEAYSDTTAPLSPSQDVTTNDDGTLSVSGTGEPGSTVTTTFPDGTTGTAVVADDGSYGPITSEAPQTTGDVSVTATDAAGNTSEPLTEAYSDTTAPLAPSQDVTPNEDGTLSVSGTGEPGSTVTTTFPDGTTGTAVVADDGTYGPITSEAPQISNDVVTTQTDQANNTSQPAVDETAPFAPDVTSANADGLSGTAEANSTITLLDSNGAPVLDANDEPVTATVGEDGTWSIPADDFPDGTTEGFTGSVTATDAAGNESTPTDVQAIDGTPPTITISTPIETDGVVNAAEDADVLVVGTTDAETGQIVTVTFTDSANATVTATATVSEGNWSLNGSGADISGLANGEITVTANVSDVAGNAATEASATATLDNTPPTITITTPIEGDDVVNAAEDADVVIAGTTDAENGQIVTVTFTDSASATVTAEATVSEGGWSLNGSEADISDFANGEITVTANVSDAAGNAATEARATVTLDNSAPTIAITPGIAGDDIVNASEDEDVFVAGTTDAEDGQIVTVTFTDSANATVTATTTVSEGGWSLNASGADISGLAEGEITVTANVSDAAGNAATEASATATLDNTVALPTINPGITDQANTVSGTGEC
ncbi:surface adhesion protein, putative [Roseobacter sp. AzwK-3b]|nr:surface adhesion protein, putative [Roseobacter sp. AzwK-3b]